MNLKSWELKKVKDKKYIENFHIYMHIKTILKKCIPIPNFYTWKYWNFDFFIYRQNVKIFVARDKLIQ